MKNTWNIRKKDDAVSPVIATILMVAITVVLAAVLYVMVIGFGSGGDSTPAGSWQASDPTSATEGKITFGAFTTDVAPLDIKLFMYADGALITTLTFSSNTAPAGTAMLQNPSVAIIANYTDFNPSGGLINSGDYIEFDGLTSATTYTFDIFHVSSDATVIMTGDDGKIITP